MFFLGIIAIQQVFFLPGIILTKFIGLKTRLITHCIAIITSSLVFNYVFVLLMTALHVYTEPP